MTKKDLGIIAGGILLGIGIQSAVKVPYLDTIGIALLSFILGLAATKFLALIGYGIWYHNKKRITFKSFLALLFLVGFFIMFCGLMNALTGDIRNLLILVGIGATMCLVAAMPLIITFLGVAKVLLFGMDKTKHS